MGVWYSKIKQTYLSLFVSHKENEAACRQFKKRSPSKKILKGAFSLYVYLGAGVAPILGLEKLKIRLLQKTDQGISSQAEGLELDLIYF